MTNDSFLTTAPAVDKKCSGQNDQVGKIMNEQEKDLEEAEQKFFETIISMILYLNKNGIRLDAVREMIQLKVEDAFDQYPKLAEDCQWKNRGIQDEDP